MTSRSVRAAALLTFVLGVVEVARLFDPPERPEIAAAPPCGFPVERVGFGVECWARVGLGVRAGDRVDANGHPVGRMSPEALTVFEVPIDPNRANAAELESLPGVGPALAVRIVEERVRGGRYASVDALVRVRGIGPKVLGRMRGRLTIGR